MNFLLLASVAFLGSSSLSTPDSISEYVQPLSFTSNLQKATPHRSLNKDIEISNLESALRRLEVSYRRESEKVVRFEIAGYVVYGQIHLCDDANAGKGCSFVVLSSNFKLNNNITLATLNTWNENAIGTRAYLRSDEAIVLEGDIQTFGGTEEDLTKSIAFYLINLEKFAKQLSESSR